MRSKQITPCRLRRNLRVLLTAFSLTVVVSTHTSAAPSVPGVVTVPVNDTLRPVREAIATRSAAGEIACVSMLVIDGGQIVWEEGLGWADAERKIPASSATIYPVASVSKSLVGLAATIAMDEGRFDLDTPVRDLR